MTYVPGRFSLNEASRLAVLATRPDPQAAARQIFLIYLRSIENRDNYACQRGQRDQFINSLLELASFLGEDAVKPLLESVLNTRIEGVEATLSALRVHPNDRNPRNCLIVSSATSASLIEALQEFAAARNVELIIR